MDQIAEVLREIRQRQRFLVTSHARPDGDAVGSTLALAQILRRMGKTADAVLHDAVPVIYRPLPHSETIIHSPRDNGSYDAAIILECDSIQRTRLEGLETCFLINIDHHASARSYANINWIDSSAVATAEMIYRLAQAAEVKLTPEIATCLYAAVLTDTGAFCYAPTNACTFELAKILVEHGADPSQIAQSIYFASPLAKMRLLGAALSRLEHEGAMTWMSVTRQEMENFGALDEDCEGLVNYALGIASVEVALFFREVSDHRIRISIRSKGAVNVARFAESFGGGGHDCAAGFATAGPLEKATERVLGELRSYLADTN